MNSESFKEYGMMSLKLFLVLYASQIAPNTPDYLVTIFHNSYVKIGLIFLMIYMVKYDFQFSLLFAMILVMGMNVASGKHILETYKNITGDEPSSYSNVYEPIGNFKLLDPQNEIVPGCENVTYNDLLIIFDNDNTKLQTSAQNALYALLNDPIYKNTSNAERLKKTIYMIGFPYNLEINDSNAPWIASLLVNYNFIISPTCKPPGY